MKLDNVLFVVTSHDELGNTGKKTGLWIEKEDMLIEIGAS